MACYRPGDRPHLYYHLRVHRRRKGEPKGFTWSDYRDLIIAAHRGLSAPLVWCWDYVPRNIIPVLCLAVLCGQRWLAVLVTGGDGLGAAAAGHIMLGLREAASSTPGSREEVVPMLETYFVKPQTADRIRACWIGAEIECYAGWLAEQGYRTRTVRRHVQVLVAFGEFARRRGASALADLPAHVDDFVAMRVASFRRGRDAAAEVRGPVEQMLTVILPGFERTGRPRRELPFARAVPGFFEYLAAERGLRPESIVCYRHHLACFEAYLDQIGVAGLAELSPAILSAFVAERSGAGLARTTVRSGCGVLRVFLRYARRQGLLAADLSKAVEWPTAYRLAASRGPSPGRRSGWCSAPSIAAPPAASAITRSCCCW